jgi:hypothetical protein
MSLEVSPVSSVLRHKTDNRPTALIEFSTTKMKKVFSQLNF